MERLILIIWSLTVFTIKARGEGLSQYASPAVQAESSRIFRPAEDTQIFTSRTPGTDLNHDRIADNHGPPHTAQNQSPRKHSQQRNAYSKIQSHSSGPFQTRNNVNNHKKFRPSAEDPFLRPEAQEYLKKYAAQLYTAQKNAAQLSDYQKFIINQDPAMKKFVFSQARSQSSRASKHKPLATNRGGEKARPELGTRGNKVAAYEAEGASDKSKTQGDVERPIPKKSSKTDPSQDNTVQSTAYKYVYAPQAEHHYGTLFVTHVKNPLENFDKYALDQFGTGSTGDYGNLKANIYNESPLSINVDESHGIREETHEDHHPTREPKYEFSYQVKDHEGSNNFGHSETRKGKTTWGKYYVQLSDGRFETVKYWADKTGYHAEVDFKGEAKHPPPQPKGHSSHFAADRPKFYLNQYSAPYQHHSFAE